MVRKIIFDDKIILWWERGKISAETLFTCYIDDIIIQQTHETYVEMKGLSADTAYSVKIITDYGETIIKQIIHTRKAKRIIDVTMPPYFAKGDGLTLNTKALQQALDDCDKNSRVFIPSGVFLSGALRMKSDTELFISPFATLQGVERVDDYLPKINSRFEGIEMQCYSALINMGEMNSRSDCNCRNIVIRGGGRIAGGGRALLENVLKTEKEKLQDYLQSIGEKISEYETPNTLPARARPRLINVSNSENVIICDLDIEYGPSWNLHLLYSENITVCGCNFRSRGIWNGDGIDPDSCNSVAIFNCCFATGDDCIAIKSGKNPEGNIIDRKCSNVYIFGCTGSGYGIAIGSEMSGGIENVYIWDCDMRKMSYGLHIKATRKRGGYVKNIFVENSKLSVFFVSGVKYNDDGIGASNPPVFSDFFIEDSVITGIDRDVLDQTRKNQRIIICGFGEDAKVKSVYFKNVNIQKDSTNNEWLQLENAENICFQ